MIVEHTFDCKGENDTGVAGASCSTMWFGLRRNARARLFEVYSDLQSSPLAKEHQTCQ